MNIITIILLVLAPACVIGITISMYVLHRNDKVYEFRQGIIDMASKAARRRIDENRDDYLAPHSLLNKHTYDQMLYSFKPLKLEAWFTEEEVKTLQGE